ncbi:MAG TPA: VWA domain-containing protein [Terracidiphilus sp.]
MKCFSRHRNGQARWAACICLGLVGIVAPMAAQNPTLKTRTKEQRDREYLEAHRITVNVQVADSSGRLVADLTASDFALLDNNEPRKIAGIHMIDGEAMTDATEVVILLDAVNSPAHELEEERQAIFDYLAHGHGPLPYPTSFVLWFNGELKATAPTTDRNILGRAFVKTTKGVHSNACSSGEGSVEQVVARPAALQKDDPGHRTENVPNCLQVHFRDSIAALDGIAQQQKTLGGRTILIWVGSGWPLLSDVEFGQPTPKARAGFFDEVANVLRDLRNAQVTIDALSLPDGTREKEFARVDVKTLMAGCNSASDAGPASLALPILATQTGGRALTSSRDLAADLSSSIRDADGYYAVSFEAMPAKSPHELHKIEVKVKRPGLDVRSMTAYYAEP